MRRLYKKERRAGYRGLSFHVAWVEDARILIVGLLEVGYGPVVRFRKPPYLFRTDFVRLPHA